MADADGDTVDDDSVGDAEADAEAVGEGSGVPEADALGVGVDALVVAVGVVADALGVGVGVDALVVGAGVVADALGVGVGVDALDVGAGLEADALGVGDVDRDDDDDGDGDDGCVGDDVGAVEGGTVKYTEGCADPAGLPVVAGGSVLSRPDAPGRAARPWLSSGVPPTVPATVGASAPLVTAVFRSGEDTFVAARVPRSTPGQTNASSSSAATSPAPAAAVARPMTILVAGRAGSTRRWAPGTPPGGRSPGIDRASSIACSRSSASARIGSRPGAHRAMQSSRRCWQARHSLRWRDTVNRRAADSTTG